MKLITFTNNTLTPTIAVCIKKSSFNKQSIINNYIKYLIHKGVPAEKLCAVPLEYLDNKATAATKQEYMDSILTPLESLGVTTLYIADADYFKFITKVPKVSGKLNYILKGKFKGYEKLDCILGVNYHSITYSTGNADKLNLSLDTVADNYLGTYSPLGEGIIKKATYPDNISSISSFLDSLHKHSTLACDIETFSLKLDEAFIGTISFAWSDSEGGAFPVDYENLPSPIDKHCGKYSHNAPVRALLLEFFRTYKGTLIGHGFNFDLRILIWNLFMNDPLDQKGLLEGLHTLCKDIHDTRIMAYLCLNSTSRPKLSLKELAHSFAGDWAEEEIKDITVIPLKKLLKYNLIDSLATFNRYVVYADKLIKEGQEDIYKELFASALKPIIQKELSGMPMHEGLLKETTLQLSKEQSIILNKLQANPLIQEYMFYLKEQAVIDKNKKLVKKVVDLDYFDSMTFNPNSDKQLVTLLHTYLNLTVLNKTKGGNPSVDKKTLQKHFMYITHKYKL